MSPGRTYSWRRAALIVLAALVALLPGSLGAQTPPALADWDVPGGHFFSQTGGGSGLGYVVSDDGGLRFWSGLQRLGGVASLGYPVSQRLQWDGFTVQIFQRTVLQWRPDCGCAVPANVLDRLHAL